MTQQEFGFDLDAMLKSLTPGQRKVYTFLKYHPGWFAVHEMELTGINENGASTRCGELFNLGLVDRRYRAGKRFKEWSIKYE